MPKTNEELAKSMFPDTPAQKLSKSLGIDNKLAETLLRMTVKDGHAKWKQPTEEQAQQWADEAMRQVRQQYGARADEVLTRAKTMIAAHPEVQEVLDASRFGSLPSVVTEIAAAASRQLDTEAATKKG